MNEDNTLNRHQDGYNTILDGKVNERLASARTILPLVVETFKPQSLLDVGCGHGAWLQVARELGIDAIHGVDGPWIDPDSLLIPDQCFLHHALETPLDLGHQFDVVVSLEVAEHIPEPAADTFIDSLVRHGQIVLFSAAIPFQGGHGHVNEKWPGYWANKFSQRGYSTIDAVRPMIWSDDSVFWWLRQNTLLFMSEDALSRHSQFREEIVTNLDDLALVHPELYLRWVGQAQR